MENIHSSPTLRQRSYQISLPADLLEYYNRELNCPTASDSIRSWKDVGKWVMINEKAANSTECQQTTLLPVIILIKNLMNALSLQEGAFQHHHRGKSMGQRGNAGRIAQMRKNKQENSANLFKIVLLNRYFTYACCACSGLLTDQKNARYKITTQLLKVFTENPTVPRTDIHLVVSNLFESYRDRRAKLTQYILRPFWSCLVDTTQFKNISLSDTILKRKLVYAFKEGEEQGPWDLNESYVMIDGEECLLAVLDHNSYSPTESASYKVVAGVPLCNEVAGISTEGKLSIPGKLRQSQNMPQGVYLASVYSSGNQSFVLPFSLPLSKDLTNYGEPMHLPNGDGLCLLWMPFENRAKLWIDFFQDDSGERPPPLYTYPVMEKMSCYVMGDDNPLFHDLGVSHMLTKYQKKAKEMVEMVRQCEQQGEDEKRNSIDQIFIALDKLMPYFVADANYYNYHMDHMQTVLSKYKTLKACRYDANNQESLDQLLSKVSELLELIHSYHVFCELTSAGGIWTIHASQSFQLLKGSTVEVTAPCITKERGECTTNQKLFRLFNSPEAGDESVLFNSCVVRHIFRHCEKIVAKSPKILMNKGVGEEICIYIPCETLEECWEKELDRFNKKIGEQIQELESKWKQTQMEQTFLDKLRELKSRGLLVDDKEREAMAGPSPSEDEKITLPDEPDEKEKEAPYLEVGVGGLDPEQESHTLMNMEEEELIDQEMGAVGGSPLSTGDHLEFSSKKERKGVGLKQLLNTLPQMKITSTGSHVKLSSPGVKSITIVSNTKKSSRKSCRAQQKYLSLVEDWALAASQILRSEEEGTR